MLSEGGPSLTVLVPYRKSKRHVLARIAQGLVEFPGFILLTFCASGRCTTTDTKQFYLPRKVSRFANKLFPPSKRQRAHHAIPNTQSFLRSFKRNTPSSKTRPISLQGTVFLEQKLGSKPQLNNLSWSSTFPMRAVQHRHS